MWMMKKVALLVLLFLGIFSCSWVRISSEEDDTDIEAQLKALNKPPVLTFEVDGDVIDCVEFYKQPAFDHPLIKNQSLQMNPSFEINGTPEVEANGEGRNGVQICPRETVPIRRTTKDDLLRHKDIESFYLDFNIIKKDKYPKYLVALRHLWVYHKDAIAARAAIGLHNPRCKGKQMTSALIGFSSNLEESKENIFAGWMKYPQLFGDDRPRMTIFWSNRERGEGCFNLLCPGFVQVHQSLRPGSFFPRYSSFNTGAYETKIEIAQDRATKNWWFIVMGVRVGYWPKELFSELERGAGDVIFGGVTIPNENHASPDMGFGIFPEEHGNGDYLTQAGFMRLMEYDIPSGPQDIVLENSHDCYRIVDKGITEQHGRVITFGGPGGVNCFRK